MERGFGIVLPDPPEAMNQAQQTLERIAALGARVVIPGHGAPFTAVQQAVDHSFARLAAVRSDAKRAARSVLKAMFSFSLLERERMPVSAALQWLQQVPIYREYNERYLCLAPEQLAQWLIEDLVRAGALRREGDQLIAVSEAA
jgi:glyoxylase-like metal-dependent hydrolase (beta-lactamase superfamily II)